MRDEQRRAETLFTLKKVVQWFIIKLKKCITDEVTPYNIDIGLWNLSSAYSSLMAGWLARKHRSSQRMEPKKKNRVGVKALPVPAERMNSKL